MLILLVPLVGVSLTSTQVAASPPAIAGWGGLEADSKQRVHGRDLASVRVEMRDSGRVRLAFRVRIGSQVLVVPGVVFRFQGGGFGRASVLASRSTARRVRTALEERQRVVAAVRARFRTASGTKRTRRLRVRLIQ